MHKIATIVAYVFYVYHFKNATIVAYAGLRVKWISMINIFEVYSAWLHHFNNKYIIVFITM